MSNEVNLRVIYEFNPKCGCGRNTPHYVVEVKVFICFTAILCNVKTKVPYYFENPYDVLNYKKELEVFAEHMRQSILLVLIGILASLLITFIVWQYL